MENIDFIDWFYQQLCISDTALLNARVYKKQFLDNSALSILDKKSINEDIEAIEWRYTLKPSTFAIPKYEDNELEYIEVALLHIILKTDVHIKRLSEVIQCAIPYPLIIVFESNSRLWVSLAEKRINRADSTKLTVDQFFNSGWMNKEVFKNSVIYAQFLESLNFKKQTQENLYSFYKSLIIRFNALDAARYTGEYRLTTDFEADKRRQENLQALKQLELHLVNLKAHVKNETQFNLKLEGNVQIKQIKQQIQHITTKLSA